MGNLLSIIGSKEVYDSMQADWKYIISSNEAFNDSWPTKQVPKMTPSQLVSCDTKPSIFQWESILSTPPINAL